LNLPSLMSKTNKIAHVYFEQLNGVRFLAVLLVLIDHWFAESLSIPLGHLGVVIFFVLSGFLITRILFEQADDIRQNSISFWVKVKNFIVRRSLRIFPIYFLVCFLGLVLNISPIRKEWIWLFTYTPNWYIMFKHTWLGVWDHFWSLAVEEQYYLLFPYFIFLLPIKKYKWLFLFMLLVGVLSRFIFYINYTAIERENFWLINYVNPFAAIDCFGLGGILAYFFHFGFFEKVRKWFNALTIIFALILTISILLLNHFQELKHASFGFLVIERFIFALFSFIFLGYSIQGKASILGKFLTFQPVEYLGKISYGIYLYHNFIFNIYHNQGNTLFGFLDNRFGLSQIFLFQNQFLLFLFNFILLTILAFLSWNLIEKPFNKLKNNFN